MNIPGSNLLKVANTLLMQTSLIYHQALSRSLNPVGQSVTTYADPVSIQGDWQPVDRAMYDQLGLQLSVEYNTLFISKDIIDIQRGVSPDIIEAFGKFYVCESNVPDFYNVDGWVGVLCAYSYPTDAAAHKAGHMIKSSVELRYGIFKQPNFTVLKNIQYDR